MEKQMENEMEPGCMSRFIGRVVNAIARDGWVGFGPPTVHPKP